jgi:hypothetical protein
MWYVESSNPEFGAMPTLSVASIDTSEGYHRPTKLKFDSTTKTGFKKAKNFGGEDYWKAMGVTPHIALTLNRDETGEPRAYLGVFRVSNFKLDEEPVIGEPKGIQLGKGIQLAFSFAALASRSTSGRESCTSAYPRQTRLSSVLAGTSHCSARILTESCPW